jgi:hypothetical protein
MGDPTVVENFDDSISHPILLIAQWFVSIPAVGKDIAYA